MNGVPDRRSPDDVRAIHIALNILGNCHSSACVELGHTKVICAVRPPQQLVQEYRGGRGRVSCVVHRSPSGAVAVTTGRSINAGDDSLERDMALALEGVAEQLVMLESIPQLLVEVVVEVISDDGGLWGAASTAMAAALAVGGFEMYDLFSACDAVLLKDGTLLTDPTYAEEQGASVVVTVCTSMMGGDVVFMQHRGMCEVATLTQLVQAAVKGTQTRKPSVQAQIRELSAQP